MDSPLLPLVCVWLDNNFPKIGAKLRKRTNCTSSPEISLEDVFAKYALLLSQVRPKNGKKRKLAEMDSSQTKKEEPERKKKRTKETDQTKGDDSSSSSSDSSSDEENTTKETPGGNDDNSDSSGSSSSSEDEGDTKDKAMKTKDSDSDDSSSSEDEDVSKKKATESDSDSDSGSSSSSEDKVEKAAKKSKKVTPGSSDSEDSSDNEAAKDKPQPSSSSDDSSSDSDSDDESSDSEEDKSNKKSSKQKDLVASWEPKKIKEKLKKGKRNKVPNRPFQRVRAAAVTFINDKLKDNTYNQGESFGRKASETLLKVRGKDFTKSKNKHKRKTYFGGGRIDMGVRSIKF